MFSGAVAHLSEEAGPGETVQVCQSNGEPLALAAYSPASNIRARVWSWDPQTLIDSDFFRHRLQEALGLRESLALEEITNAYRLVNAESDGLPGVVVDRYADTLVLQCLTAGAERWRETIADLLVELTGISNIYERSDVDIRQLEGLPARSGLLRGQEPAELVEIREHELKFWVDLRQGHKTGFYLDQRQNRDLVRCLASGKDVLDAFSYTGGFGLSALFGGARRVVAIEVSNEAIALGKRNLALNQLPAERMEWIQGNVFQVLRAFRDRGFSFDLIVLDPPKFAISAAQRHQAARGYKDINLLGIKLLRPGGLLVTFSCSGGVSAEFFQQVVGWAAQDAGAEMQIIRRLHQAADHPVGLNFPEGAYLKGLVLHKM